MARGTDPHSHTSWASVSPPWKVRRCPIPLAAAPSSLAPSSVTLMPHLSPCQADGVLPPLTLSLLWFLGDRCSCALLPPLR